MDQIRSSRMPMYDVMAEIAIKEAGNRPFATPVNPVFMSSYFVNENIRKLIPGRPYDAKRCLSFLVTPHKQENQSTQQIQAVKNRL